MSKVAFLFAGQGAQTIGMAKEFYDNFSESKALMDSFKLDFDVKNVCFNGPSELLDDTAYAQSCIVAASLTILETLKAKGVSASCCAGLSLGEYSALAYANAFDAQTAVSVVRERGKIMANALPKGTSGMSAVLGLDATAIEQACKEVSQQGDVVEIANYNCPGQIVITGSVSGIEKVTPLLMDKGARRVIPLNVSGAFHSSLLNEASNELENVLKQSVINVPTIPVYHNISGEVGSYNNTSDLIDILKKQICSSVRFEQTLRNMINDGVDTFIEIGPGKTLSGFVKKIDRNVTVYSINTISDLEGMLSTWNN